MKWTVTIGWAIYPIGYFLGYLAGGTDGNIEHSLQSSGCAQ